MSEQPRGSRHEEFRIDGSDLMDRARQLVDEGNRRRLVVRNEHGTDVFDLPLTVAVVGGILVLPATAVGVIAALATRHSIVVESVAEAGAATNGTSSTNGASGPDEASTDASQTLGVASHGDTTVTAPESADTSEPAAGAPPDRDF